MIYEVEKIGRKASRKRLRVTFPDGEVICYKNATDTFLEVLKKFNPELLATTGLEIGHLPMFSQTVYPEMKQYMKPLSDGWFVNTRNDSSGKYLQLRSISEKLNLGLTVELSEDFDDIKTFETERKRAPRDSFFIFVGDNYVTFNNGDENLAFVEVFKYLDATMLSQKSFEIFGKELVTKFKKYPEQVELPGKLWLTLPQDNKKRIRVFEALNEKFKFNIEIVRISEADRLAEKMAKFAKAFNQDLTNNE